MTSYESFEIPRYLLGSAALLETCAEDLPGRCIAEQRGMDARPQDWTPASLRRWSGLVQDQGPERNDRGAGQGKLDPSIDEISALVAHYYSQVINGHGGVSENEATQSSRLTAH